MARIEQAFAEIGTEWKRTGTPYQEAKHRVYFNHLWRWYGLRIIARYNTGSINYAKFRGADISNNRARKMYHRLRDAKLWYDFETKKFHWSGFGDSEEDRADALYIVGKIKAIAERMCRDRQGGAGKLPAVAGDVVRSETRHTLPPV